MRSQAVYTIVVVLVGLGFLFTIPACNNKKSDAAPIASTPDMNGVQQVQAGCVNCGNVNTPILMNVQTSSYSQNFQAGLDFYADPNLGVNLADPKAIVAYRGPLHIVGILVIRQNGDHRVCNAPAGEYQLTSQSPGLFNVGVIESAGGFRLMAQGQGVQLGLDIMNGFVSNHDGGGVRNGVSTNRVSFNLRLWVNGQPCGTIATY